jgi:hypothetical protein
MKSRKENNKVSRVVDITEISAVVAAVGVVIGVFYYILDMRHQSKVRQTDLVNRLYSAFLSPELMDVFMKFSALEFNDYEDYVNRYGPILSVGKHGSEFNDTPELRSLLFIDNFFNQVGCLLYRKLIDADLVRDVFSYRVEFFWKKAEPLIKGCRKESNQPEMGKWFEYLYNEMKKREQQVGVKNG